MYVRNIILKPFSYHSFLSAIFDLLIFLILYFFLVPKEFWLREFRQVQCLVVLNYLNENKIFSKDYYKEHPFQKYL
jgi:hypothetical protein